MKLGEKRSNDSPNGTPNGPGSVCPALLDLLEEMRSADGGELMHRLPVTMLQLLDAAEATAFIGAGPHERSEARTTHRNGNRDKSSSRRRPAIKSPKVREGSFFLQT